MDLMEPAVIDEMPEESVFEAALFEEEDDVGFEEEAIPFFRGRRRRGTPRVPPGFLTPTRPGVQSGRIETPRGSATIRMPEPLVTQSAFREAIQKLETTINGVSSSLSSQIATAQKQADTALRQNKVLYRSTRTAIAKLRKDYEGQAMTNMMMSMMMQQSAQRRLESHRHLGDGSVDRASLPPDTSFMLMMMLPMLTSTTEGKGMESMMLPMMGMAMMSMMGPMASQAR